MNLNAQENRSPEHLTEARLLVDALEAAGQTSNVLARLPALPPPPAGPRTSGAPLPSSEQWRSLQSEVIAKVMPPERIRELRIEAYADAFTTIQLRAIREFVESPPGRAFFAAQTGIANRITSELVPAMQAALEAWEDPSPSSKPVGSPP